MRTILWSAAFGLLLIVVGLLFTGMGEGSDAVFAAFGSPFSLITPIFMIAPVLLWTFIGGWLAAGYPRVAAAVLVLHFVLIVPAIGANLREPGNWANDWRLLQRTCSQDEKWCALLLVPYVVGQAVAWTIVAGQLSKPNRIRGRAANDAG